MLAVIAAGPCSAQIRRVQYFRENASYGACSPDGSIVFQRDGEIWIAGSNPASDRCITCRNPPIGRTRNTAPVWFPGGKLFLFRSGPAKLMAGDPSGHVAPVPGIDSRAADFRFSRDAKLLAWTQLGQPPAAFVANVSGTQISSARRLVLPRDLIFQAVDDFLPGSGELLITASRRDGDTRFSGIFACSVKGPSDCRAITNNPGQHDEYARVTPSGTRILFASTAGGYQAGPGTLDFKSDYFLLDLDAARNPQGAPRRMTWFNEPANPNYIENAVRAETASWAPDGKWLLATLLLDARRNTTRLVKIEFPEIE